MRRPGQKALDIIRPVLATVMNKLHVITPIRSFVTKCIPFRQGT